uniref:Uncharacterized protein n=1 Tax=Oryza punctata TaxID=4537 RepID=A0A0E0LVZ3_ORYPU
MEEDYDTVIVDGGGQRVVRTREEEDDISTVEAKALLWASLPDTGQRTVPNDLGAFMQAFWNH